jgi:hypothetical protein
MSPTMQALQIYAGPSALKHLRAHGLKPAHVKIIPAAAGGPKGLILNPLDKFIFNEWLPQSTHTVHLLGASIGAWRMAAAMLKKPQEAFERLAHDYIHQSYETPPGRKGPTADHVSEKFGESLQAFFDGQEQAILNHARYRLHIVTSRGRHVLGREGRWRTPLGYAGAFATNIVQRKAMGAWLERVIFSDRREGLPINLQDYRTRVVHLSEKNFAPALQASCSIPFVLRAVHDIPGAPRGAYWDGGITDYHLHLNYRSLQQSDEAGLVLYPHFQRQVVPGWLDKSLKWRHKSSAFLDNLIVLAPTAEWVKTLPNHKLPDRTDFNTYATDFNARVKVWSQATTQAQQLADELAHLIDKQDWSTVKPL